MGDGERYLRADTQRVTFHNSEHVIKETDCVTAALFIRST